MTTKSVGGSTTPQKVGDTLKKQVQPQLYLHFFTLIRYYRLISAYDR